MKFSYGYVKELMLMHAQQKIIDDCVIHKILMYYKFQITFFENIYQITLTQSTFFAMAIAIRHRAVCLDLGER